MNLTIRSVRIEDAVFINEMRRMDGVRENTLGIISERLSRNEEYIKSLSENDHMLVAEVEENGVKKVVGVCSLNVYRNNRMRHSASIGIMVHSDYQGKGIGKALMTKILDLADNWLMLVRVELTVFVDNTRAINLYKSLGFEIEGKKKYAAIRYGEYADEYIMARYNNIPVKKNNDNRIGDIGV
ncbi:MAG: GNAT family N-acetyltransferase [Clostridiaceae bacterium]|nr:GNAT family N-acetyltransferase [Clostridiaceae bacterium]